MARSLKRFEKAWATIEDQLRDSPDHPLELEHATTLAAFCVVEPLVAKLDDEDLRIVLTAASALGNLPAAADQIVPLLVPRLSDPNAIVAEHMRWTLRELGAAALPALMDAYASDRARQVAIAEALAFQGPRAAPAALILREDAKTDEQIAAALRAIDGPWPPDPVKPIAYLGEAVRLDAEGPGPLSYYALGLWLDAVQWASNMDETLWDRAATPEHEVHRWRPDLVAFAAPTIVVGAYDARSRSVEQVTLHAPDGQRFTNQQLLWALLDAHHRVAPCNDRIFEGLRLDEDAADGSYYISTGS